MMVDNDFPNALGFLKSYSNGLSGTNPELDDVLVQETIARGIPVGEDPIFPMSQEEFSDYVYGRLDQKKGLRPQLPDEIKNRIRSAKIKFGLI